MFDTFEEYFKFDTRNLSDIWSQSYTKFWAFILNELVYCQNASAHKIAKYYETLRKKLYAGHLRIEKQFHMKSFLFEDNRGEIVLMALSLFSPNSCGKFKMVELNRFSRKTLKWKTKEFFTPEINNFNGCELNFYVDFSESIVPSARSKDKINDDFESECSYEGYLISLVADLASNLNYTYKLFCYRDNQTDHLAYDLKLEAETYSNYNDYIYVTSSTMFDFYGIFIPPGELYSPLEKFFLPFDFATWMMFVAVFLIAYFTVFLVSYFSDPSIQEFIYGENVQAPSVNIFLIFMGGGMIVLPRKNFPRFLVMVFILYCLIMRFVSDVVN